MRSIHASQHAAMPRDLADALYEYLLDRFPADRDYPRKALYVEGMPPLVADLLGRTLDRWLEHELDGLESRWFDFDDPGVRAARAELIVALSRTARVPRGAWSETLRYAVGLVLRHLVDPARALTDATFEGEAEELPTETVRNRLRTFKAYDYLPEIADAYLAERQLETVDPDTLHGLLLRIDRRVTREYGVDDWLRLLGPLFKLSRRVPDLKGVPASILEQFFAAKGQAEVAASLKDRGSRPVDESALHEIIVGSLGIPPLAEPVTDDAPDDVDADVAPEAEPEPEPVEGVAHEMPGDSAEESPQETIARGEIAERFSETPAAMPAPPEEPEPLWKRFAEGSRGPTIETAIPADASSPAPAEARSDEVAERPLWARFFSARRHDAPAESEDGGPAPATTRGPSVEDLEDRLLDGITARQRKTYVRDLFRGDERAYANVLEQIDACESWSEASQVIASEVFRRHGVDIYAETAVSFTDRVQGAFRH